MKAFATAFYNEKASVAAFTEYCTQEEHSIVVAFRKYRRQNRGTLVLKHTAPNCKLRICTFTPSGPFLYNGSGKVIKMNSCINYLHILITKTWSPCFANKIWLIYTLRPHRPLWSVSWRLTSNCDPSTAWEKLWKLPTAAGCRRGRSRGSGPLPEPDYQYFD